ncbi:glycosyltransferase [Vreelandella sulfidaeris]|uniref:glycosyltransferase n=1 Tax=Vreelandella sulfidaeris TaxID=115553 RepID=UPI0035EA6356
MNKHKIKVLHFGLSLNRGGIETYLHKIATGVNADKFEFSFINSTTSLPCFYKELSDMGCVFHNITPRRINFKKNKRDLEALFKEHDFDVLHFHVNTLSYIEPVLVALRNNVKVIIHSRNAGAAGSHLTQWLHRINKIRIQRLRYRVTKISVSQLAGEWLFGKGDDFIVYNNGIDLNRFRFSSENRRLLREELGINDTTFLLGNVGAFVPAKNQEFAVNVLKKMIDSGEDTKLLLIGDGGLKENVINLVARLGLVNNVLFLGKREDMPALYSAMDMFIFPSFYEGFPNAVLEAQACGLPCFISNKITKEVVIDENSVKQFSVSNSNYYEWVSAILFYVKNELIDYAHMNSQRGNAWEKIETAGFSTNREIKKLEDLYEKVVF